MYGIREQHPVFHGPLPLDLGATRLEAAPDAFQQLGAQVEVLPLVADPGRGHSPGWCSYADQLQGSPDIEILCGGLNDKTPTAAALWRQGHLMHFGFQPSPAEMNANGQALLVNAICYIALFRGDQALLEVPSPFAGDPPQPPSRLRSYLTKYEEPDWYVPRIVPEELAGVEHTVEALLAWHDAHAPYFQATDSGQWQVDLDARRLDLRVADEDLVPQALTYAASPERWSAAARILARALPDGPGRDASPEAWKEWYGRHRTALFFSEFGGNRWYVDRLALHRGVPTEELRGPSRAAQTAAGIPEEPLPVRR